MPSPDPSTPSPDPDPPPIVPADPPGPPPEPAPSPPEPAPSPGSCAELDEASCRAAAHCAAMYDDACCPTCTPGICADCYNPTFTACLETELACYGFAEVCGWIGEGECPDETPPDPAPDHACLDGEVPAILSSDRDCDGDGGDCLLECHAVTGDTCTVRCRSLPPPCPAGWYAEGDGFCYTGYCIPDSVCAADPWPGSGGGSE